jgi:hypothetical protein
MFTAMLLTQQDGTTVAELRQFDDTSLPAGEVTVIESSDSPDWRGIARTARRPAQGPHGRRGRLTEKDESDFDHGRS